MTYGFDNSLLHLLPSVTALLYREPKPKRIVQMCPQVPNIEK